MNKLRDEFCQLIKKKFPVISGRADVEYERLWDDFTDSEYYSYSWFEALANALNEEMKQGIPASEYSDLFSTISANYEKGDQNIQQCIDVAFVENLFWQVPGENASSYWATLPEILKELYVDFHHRTPL
jgi:hypothetical protein